MFVIVFLFFFLYLSDIPLNDAHCMDIHKQTVSQGLHYVPGPNPCTLCICDKGSPKWCKQVLCSPPQNCKSFEVGNSCCEFKCLDDILSKSDNYSETYDLALRLIASAVTAVLSLSLLFFLIHRLRQRKIRLRQNRQLSEDQRSLNSIGYITGSLAYLPGSIGYLGSGNNEMEFHYDESNVHYPLWKPPGNYFPRGEAPPPYEEAVRAARAEAEMVNNHSQVNSNAAPFTFSSNRNENVSLTLVHNTHVSITPSVQQSGVASSQCNVMLHQSNNMQPDARTETPADPQQNPTANSSTSVSLACGSGGASHDYVIDSSSSFLQNATLESQVDVHYENYNHNVANAAPVVTVSVKNEESFPKQALSVDFLRDRIDRSTYTAPDNKTLAVSAGPAGPSTDNQQSKNESSALSCSSSWRREAAQHSREIVQHSRETAQHSRETAQHSRETAQHSRETAQHSRETAQHSRETAQHSRETSQHSRETAQHSRETAQHNRETAQHSREAAQHSREVTQHSREAPQHSSSAKANYSASHDMAVKQKYVDKKNYAKVMESATSGAAASKSYRSENPHVDPKFKKCNIMLKENPKSGKALTGRSYDKQRMQSKSHGVDSSKDIIIQETGTKHRTIPQKFSKTLGALETEMGYVNATDIVRRKHDDDFSEHCDMILKQHNIDKLRYAAEKLEKKHAEKSLIRNSFCAPAELRSTQRGSSSTSIGMGMLKGDVSAHRTLPKNLRELSEAFYFNFDSAVCEEMNLDCLIKKTLPRNSGSHVETSLPPASTSVDKQTKSSENSAQTFPSNGTIGRKHATQDKKPSSSTSNSSNTTASTINPSCYRGQVEAAKPIERSEKTDPARDAAVGKEPEAERDRSCVSYHCLSPTQDDVDDYRSECENCKSLSFEDCNDEEGDLLNETMTLQRRPTEQGEEHSFYRTSLTLPSHTKKTSRSVTLNTPRESWFMAMQEMTSSSESD